MTVLININFNRIYSFIKLIEADIWITCFSFDSRSVKLEVRRLTLKLAFLLFMFLNLSV